MIMKLENEFRPLSDSERALLNRLFEINFIGREQLARQLPNLLAKKIEDSGSLEFQVQGGVLAPLDGCIAEASCKDADTTESNSAKILVLLHVKQGKLWLLEIYKENMAPIHNQPKADDLENLFTAHPPSP